MKLLEGYYLQLLMMNYKILFKYGKKQDAIFPKSEGEKQDALPPHREEGLLSLPQEK